MRAWCPDSLSKRRSRTIVSCLPKSGRKQNACFSLRCWRGRRRKTAATHSGQGTMTNPDLELLRLEEVLRLARDRLARISRMVADPAVVKAAEDLCAEAAAA